MRWRASFTSRWRERAPVRGDYACRHDRSRALPPELLVRIRMGLRISLAATFLGLGLGVTATPMVNDRVFASPSAIAQAMAFVLVPAALAVQQILRRRRPS